MTLQEKYNRLHQSIQELGSVGVAFSGGVDSTFLLKTAHDILGENAVAITARSLAFPEGERREAEEFCRREGISQYQFDLDEFSIEGFVHNSEKRCYYCKSQLFIKMWEVAKAHEILYLAEGSNVDDEGDYRPGHLAIAEQGIKSPLRYAGLTKADIRELSRKLGLPTWEKPSFACLASRVAYGEKITPEKLDMVGRAEQLLKKAGFTQFRVRTHGDMARIEVLPYQFPGFLEESFRSEIYREMKEIGFSYVTLDLGGYRTGSMNEALRLQQEDKHAQ